MSDAFGAYIVNKSSLIQISIGNNYIFFYDDCVYIGKGTYDEGYIFSVNFNGEYSFIQTHDRKDIRVGDELVVGEYRLQNRNHILFGDEGEVLYFEIRVDHEIKNKDKHELIVGFLKNGYLPNIDIMELLRAGAQELKAEEFFSILAQVDVPEIDQ